MDTQLTLHQTAEPTLAERNPALVYLATLASPLSRSTMRTCLDTLAGLLSSGQADAAAFPWHAVRFQHVALIRSHLAERYKPATANKHLAALRGVLKAAWRLGLMSSDDYRAAVDVKPVKGETLPKGRNVTPGELTALMTACCNDTSPAGARDAAMLAVLYCCGVRRSELVAFDVSDLDLAEGRLVVKRGKGRKERVIPVNNGCADALTDWLDIRGTTPGPLFCAVRKGGHLARRQRLTTQAVYEILTKRAQEAGVKKLSPHDLRRTFIGDLLDAGADISTVQQLAGHASVITTQRYDRRGEETKRRAAALLHIPYPRGGGWRV